HGELLPGIELLYSSCSSITPFIIYIDYISIIRQIQVKEKWLSSHRQAYGFSPRIYNNIIKA
ncbi:MAG: hypothetical protein PUG37_07660, partial [Bacillales bacterium]|nr:hypothetical protein [Bacillales bacterium]